MKKFDFSLQAGGLALLLTLAACSPQDAPEGTTDDAAVAAQAERVVAERAAPPPAPVVCVTCGVVSSISAITQEGRGTGIGAAVGGVVGGLAGNQVGGGSGRKIATVAGVIGGAVLGNNIEKNRNTSTSYEVVVDMENGNQQIINVPDASGIAVGSKVTVQSGNISLR